jgi:hypothetical protein
MRSALIFAAFILSQGIVRDAVRECYRHISDDLKEAEVNAKGKRAGLLGSRLKK